MAAGAESRHHDAATHLIQRLSEIRVTSSAVMSTSRNRPVMVVRRLLPAVPQFGGRPPVCATGADRAHREGFPQEEPALASHCSLLDIYTSISGSDGRLNDAVPTRILQGDAGDAPLFRWKNLSCYRRASPPGPAARQPGDDLPLGQSDRQALNLPAAAGRLESRDRRCNANPRRRLGVAGFIHLSSRRLRR